MSARWRLPASTRLLLACAGCALLAAVAVRAGAGGGYTLLHDDPALVPPLPAAAGDIVPAASGGPWLAARERPLFNPDRRPAPVQLAEGATGTQEVELELTGVILTRELGAALVVDRRSGRSERVFLGDAVPGSPGWSLVELERRSAVFEGPAGRTRLDLRVFDGGAGTPAMGGPRPADPAQYRDPPPPPPSRDTGAVGIPPMFVPAPGPGGDEADVDAGWEPSPTAGELEAEAIRRSIEERRSQLRQGGEW